MAPAPHSEKLLGGAPAREYQAVILAAGYARRMQPLSDHCHKALLTIGGDTILGRIMENLSHVHVNHVTVVTGYRAQDIEDFLRANYPLVTFRFLLNSRYRETNNIVSLSLAFENMDFDRDVILVECDLLFDQSLMVKLLDHPGRNVALVDRYRTGMDGTVVEIRDGWIDDVYPGAEQGADFTYENKFKTLNIYRFDKDFCRTTFGPLLHTYSNSIDSSSYYEVVLGMLINIRKHRIGAAIVTGERWAEVDDPNDFAVAEFQFNPSRRSAILDGAFGGHWNFDMIDFSFMRNEYFPSGQMLAAMRFSLPELIAGYGSAQHVLNEKLGYFLKCDRAHLQVLHGASQVFPILAQLFADRSMAIPTATFGEYARLFPGARTYLDAPGLDWSEVERCAVQCDLVVFVNPNTSTGTTVATRDIYALAKDTPETVFLVDESFLAFSDEPSMLHMLEAEPLDNVLVIVSLSKSLGAPGLRLGYVYSRNLALLADVGRHLPIWNLSSPAEYLLELLLKFTPAYEKSLKDTRDDRDTLRAMLLAIPLVDSVPPSGGNFLLVNLHGDDAHLAKSVRNYLLEQFNMEVKDVTAKFADDRPRLRIAIRSAPDNARLVGALESFSPVRAAT